MSKPAKMSLEEFNKFAHICEITDKVVRKNECPEKCPSGDARCTQWASLHGEDVAPASSISAAVAIVPTAPSEVVFQNESWEELLAEVEGAHVPGVVVTDAQILGWHGELVGLARRSIVRAFLIGRAMQARKDTMAHGMFGPWVTKTLGISDSTGRLYRQVFRWLDGQEGAASQQAIRAWFDCGTALRKLPKKMADLHRALRDNDDDVKVPDPDERQSTPDTETADPLAVSPAMPSTASVASRSQRIIKVLNWVEKEAAQTANALAVSPSAMGPRSAARRMQKLVETLQWVEKEASIADGLVTEEEFEKALDDLLQPDDQELADDSKIES